MTGREVRCYIGIGSNMGDSKATINEAINIIQSTAGINLLSVAPYYRTAPVGYADQDYFINTVAEINTTLNPRQLLHRLQEIENQKGRVRVIHWGPRTLDLDILLYGEQVISDPDLEVPHPRMHQRAFVMVPLADLNPNMVIHGKKASELAQILAKEQFIEKC